MAMATFNDGEKFLLYRIGLNGLGHVLISVLNAAAKAVELGRSLAVDARQFIYFGENQQRQFFECFEIIAPQGLKIYHEVEDLERISSLKGRLDVLVHTEIGRANGATEELVFVNTVPLTTCYTLKMKSSPPEYRIALRGWLADQVSEALSEFSVGGPVIGLYFRDGNGEYLHGRFDRLVFSNHEAMLSDIRDEYIRAARRVADERGYEGVRFFVASDNADFVGSMKEMIPNSFSLSQQLPDRSFTDHIKVNAHSRHILFEAVQDIWALSECDALVYSESLFARCAALNSAKLDEKSIFDIKAPKLQDYLSSLPPHEALSQAQAAYKAFDNPATALALAGAMRRTGDEDSAQKLEKRVAWWRAAWMTSKEVKAAELAGRTGRLDDAIRMMADFVASIEPNPYVLSFYASLLERKGRGADALALLDRCVALDDGIVAINDHLARLTRKQLT